jgi:hypothetical protein
MAPLTLHNLSMRRNGRLGRCTGRGAARQAGRRRHRIRQRLPTHDEIVVSQLHWRVSISSDVFDVWDHLAD